MARRYNWVPRAQAWDQENERIKRASQIKGIESMARRQVLAGQLMMSKGIKRLQAMSDDEVALLSVWEAKMLTMEGAKLERQGYGAPEDVIVQQNVVNIGGSTIRDILRANPTRVGPIIAVLEELKRTMPELAAGDTVYYDPDEPDDLTDLLGDETVDEEGGS